MSYRQSMTYHAPKNAIQYLLTHTVDIGLLMASQAHQDLSLELISDILEGSSQFSSEVLAPLNRAGDENGAHIKDGVVTAAPGFKGAYQAFVDAGWQGLSAPTDIGGMGLPQIVSVGANEMIYAANMAFGLCPMLTGSAMNAIHAHASTEIKDKYLGKMVTGEWTGGMNLTEPQAGSDLGVLRAKAVPNSDGTYAISGQKIFITWGEHDCADNIIHLVLARLPDAPAGSRGISLFLVPKYFVGDDGALGARNSFKAIGLEHKLGIHGSPTCVMEFEGATGWLIGPENKGLACMFTMMNEARLFVGVQGVAIGERAYQLALSYAEERVQGRTISGAPDETIIGHPDVRRMLMDMKAGLMGARTINIATAFAGDMAACTTDETAKKTYHDRDALLTPIAKAYGSDMGVWAASIGLQVHGGMGFIEETGAAQHYRDARITPIYEGTNGIQAIDLAFRKLRRDGGAAMNALISELEDIVAATEKADEKEGQNFGCNYQYMLAGVSALKTATEYMLSTDDKDALAAATPYLSLCGDVISGVFLIKSVLSGMAANDQHAANMKTLAWHHSISILSRASSYLEPIMNGAGSVFAYPLEQLADL